MRISITSLIALLLVLPALGAPPAIPRTNEVVRYEREQPVFQSKLIVHERGDALLSALDGGQQIQEVRIPPGVHAQDHVCALPIPAKHWLSITLTNGGIYRIGVSDQGALVYLPEGLYEVTDAARERVARVMTQLDEDLRQEIVSAPKPVVYKVGTVDDGGTLSGISRLFYGDATRWKQIYEAYRKLIKNPNVIDASMRLTIPKP
jgi:hypothetical protein